MEHRSDSMSRGQIPARICIVSRLIPLCRNAPWRSCTLGKEECFDGHVSVLYLYLYSYFCVLQLHLGKRSVMVGSSFRHVANNIHLGLLLLGNLLLDHTSRQRSRIIFQPNLPSTMCHPDTFPALVFSASCPHFLDHLTPQHFFGILDVNTF